jgi:hypothetical protein
MSMHGFEGNVVAALEVLHGGAEPAGTRGDDRSQVFKVDGILLAESTMLDSASRHALQLRMIEGFEKIVDGAAAKGAGRDLGVVDAAEEYDRDGGIVRGYLVEQFEPIGPGHDDIGEDKVVVGVLLQAAHGRFRARDRSGLVVAALEQRGDDVTH